MFQNDNPLRMWYDLPSSKIPLLTIPQDEQNQSHSSVNHNIWQQNTLPIGNGFIGANIFGEIQNEVLTFNELTLWEGGPSSKRPNYNGCNNIDNGQNGTTFRLIQQLFTEGKDAEAISLSESQLLGDHDGTGQYIGLGEIHLNFDIDEQKVTNYEIKKHNLTTTKHKLRVNILLHILTTLWLFTSTPAKEVYPTSL